MNSASTGQKPLRAAGLLAVLALAAYFPALKCGYIWDDDFYVTENPALENARGLVRIWTQPSATPQYYPLVFTTFWFERRLWGLNPAGYHLVNILLHGANAGLLYLILRRFEMRGAWLAAALFAVHPVQAESVVWITERKNILSGFFYFLSFLAYLEYTPRSFAAARGLEREAMRSAAEANRAGNPKFYYLSLICFALALLAKTTACTLPITLGLLLLWRRGKITEEMVTPLAPMLLAGLLMGLNTAWLEKHSVGAQGLHWNLSWAERIEIASRAPWFYLGKLLWPLPQCFIYPRWNLGLGAGSVLFPLLAAGAAVIFWRARKRIGSAPLIPPLLFLAAIFPALGFFDVYPFRYSFVADHFQYLAAAPIFAVLAAGFARIGKGAHRRGNIPALTAILVPLIGLTWLAIPSYKNEEALWRTNLRKNPAGAIAYNNLGSARSKAKDYEGALKIFEQGIRHAPEDVDLLNNLGGVLVQLGRIEEGIARLNSALALDPNSLSALNNLALAALAQNRLDDAIALSKRVLDADRTQMMAYNNLAAAYVKQGQMAEAIYILEKGLKFDPSDPMLRANLDQLTGGK
ncbi:tetratricopeptide repeat protein [Candidatus Sumerlaeota bacterium]|nr:tetratricopeptide repeat protein [Candidatus Sumerlaeota bacterium]